MTYHKSWNEWVEMRKGEPWDVAEVKISKMTRERGICYIAFLVKREILFKPKFKQLYYDAKNKLDKQE
jgi:hypothetical protein